MYRWRIGAEGAWLRTVVGKKDGDRIAVAARKGIAVYGPYLDMPPGRLTLTVLLAPA